MITRLTLGLAIFLLICCSRKSNQGSADNPINTFKSPYDTLDFLSVPLTLTPSDWSKMYMDHLEKFGPKEGWEIWKHPYARLLDKENFKGIIFSSTDETGAPTLITINRTGKQIDALRLLGDWSSNDPSNWTSEVAIINKDYSIQLIDSVSTYDLGQDGDRIESSRKLTVKKENYKILDNGKIQRVE